MSKTAAEATPIGPVALTSEERKLARMRAHLAQYQALEPAPEDGVSRTKYLGLTAASSATFVALLRVFHVMLEDEVKEASMSTGGTTRLKGRAVTKSEEMFHENGVFNKCYHGTHPGDDDDSDAIVKPHYYLEYFDGHGINLNVDIPKQEPAQLKAKESGLREAYARFCVYFSTSGFYGANNMGEFTSRCSCLTGLSYPEALTKIEKAMAWCSAHDEDVDEDVDNNLSKDEVEANRGINAKFAKEQTPTSRAIGLVGDFTVAMKLACLYMYVTLKGESLPSTDDNGSVTKKLANDGSKPPSTRKRGRPRKDTSSMSSRKHKRRIGWLGSPVSTGRVTGDMVAEEATTSASKIQEGLKAVESLLRVAQGFSNDTEKTAMVTRTEEMTKRLADKLEACLDSM